MTARIVLHVYSGLENPAWDLDAETWQQVSAVHSQHVTVNSKLPSILGFAGIFIFLLATKTFYQVPANAATKAFLLQILQTAPAQYQQEVTFAQQELSKM